MQPLDGMLCLLFGAVLDQLFLQVSPSSNI